MQNTQHSFARTGFVYGCSTAAIAVARALLSLALATYLMWSLTVFYVNQMYHASISVAFVMDMGIRSTWDALLENLDVVSAILVLTVYGVCTAGVAYLLHHMTRVMMRGRYFLKCTVACSVLAVPVVLYAGTGESASAAVEWNPEENSVEWFQPSNREFSTKAKEHVFILQLESANSLAVNGYGTDEVGTNAYEKYMPTLTKIAREHGVLLPKFWGNNTVTHRGMMAMLCGPVANIYGAFPEHLSRITSRCLPEILRDGGYATAFYSAYPRPHFMNKNAFSRRAGIDDRNFAEYMDKSDPRATWGYDDCVFYDKTFQHMNDKYKDDERPLFAYFAMSTHHTNFPKGRQYLHPYAEPKSWFERYMNSNAYQDHCLSVFFEEYQKTYGENGHLFILSDHSFPVIMGHKFLQKAEMEDFVVPFAYIPPASRRDEFAIGKVEDDPRFSQTDMIATIFDLLNGTQKHNNSFAFALRKEQKPLPKSLFSGRTPKYEDCHVLTQHQPGAKHIVVVRWPHAYTYRVDNGHLQVADLSVDLLGEEKATIAENLPFAQFRKEYFCERFDPEAQL